MLIKLLSIPLILTGQFAHGQTIIKEKVIDATTKEPLVEATIKCIDPPQVAITNLTAKTIQDAKSTSIDQLLNKVSGVYMVNLGNEEHHMSIRQPMTTKSLFLYLEEGIPIRTSGLSYNFSNLFNKH